MQGEKFTLMQYNVNAILGFIEAGQFVINCPLCQGHFELV